MPKRVISLFCVEYMPRLLPIKFVGDHLCLSESLGHRKFFSRGYRDSPLIFFGLTVLKNFVGNAFNLPESFGYRNFLCMGTENHVFLPKFLCLTKPKKFVVTTSKFQKTWDLGNFHAYHGFPSIFFVSQYRKTSRATI